MFLFPVYWQIESHSYSGQVEMTLSGSVTIYSARIVRNMVRTAEVEIELFFNGEEWVQRNPKEKEFNSFFLQCLGKAIDQALVTGRLESVKKCERFGISG